MTPAAEVRLVTVSVARRQLGARLAIAEEQRRLRAIAEANASFAAGRTDVPRALKLRIALVSFALVAAVGVVWAMVISR